MVATQSEEGRTLLGKATSFVDSFGLYIESIETELSEKAKIICQLQKQLEDVSIRNESLHAKLQEVSNRGATPIHDSSSFAQPPPESDGGSTARAIVTRKRTDWKSEYEQLTKKYDADIRHYEESHAILLKKVRKWKKSTFAWANWAKKIETRKTQKESTGNENLTVHEDENETTSQLVPSLPSTARSSPPLRLSDARENALTPAVASLLPENVDHHDTIANEEARMDETNHSGHPAGKEAATDFIGDAEPNRNVTVEQREIPDSSQTTASPDSRSEPFNARTSEPPVSVDDDPVFVSARSTRKRKRGESRPTSDSRVIEVACEKRSPANAICIKEELHSSPAGGIINRAIVRTETLDLDELGDHIDTPRKRRQARDILRRKMSFRTASLDEPERQLSTSNAFDLEPEFESEYQRTSLLAASHDVPLLRPAVLRRIESDPSLDIENNVCSGANHSLLITNELKEHQTPSRPQLKILEALGSNQRNLPRTNNGKINRRRREAKREVKALHAVAEDGTFSLKEKQNPLPESKSKTDKRLEDLLKHPMPATPLIPPFRPTKEAVSSMKTPIAAKAVQLEGTAVSGVPPTPESLGCERSHAFKLPEVILPPGGQMRRTVKSLRERPMAALSSEDFKPNPKTSRDVDDSAERGRTREDRRHMAGCTDPTCSTCGDQLEILAAGLPVSIGSALFASTQDQTMTEDEKLLKYYLGDRFSSADISGMGSQERQDMITAARRKLISERYIRHRIKPNQRSKSPPGFWNVEMPSTQELLAQREEADRRERVIVSARYSEAMREGGKWIFRDE